MLTLEELKVLMAGPESNLVEKTESINKTDKFAQAICAFANDFPNHRRPGYLLIGVRDNGCPSGLQVNEKLLQNLASLRSDGNILPRLFYRDTSSEPHHNAEPPSEEQQI